MPKVLEKIKNFFSGTYVYRPKCSARKEEPQPKIDQPLADKAEEIPEEQKQQPST
jgi:hypothetical protein